MKLYTTISLLLTASACLNAMDAVTSATPQNQEQTEKIVQPEVKKNKPVQKIQKKKAEVKKNKPVQKIQKKKSAIKKPQKKKNIPVPASVNISTFLSEANDITDALQKAIATKSQDIVFDKAGSFTLRPVKLPARVQITFNEGVKLQGAAPEKADAVLPGLFNIDSSTRVVIKGLGNNSITAPQGMPVFNITNSNNIELRNLTIENTGNGIKMTNSYAVKMYSMVFDNIASNALEINGGNWNSIYDSQFRNLAGTGAVISAGKDGKLPNMNIDNCEFFNSNSGLVLRRNTEQTVSTPTDKKPRPARFDLRSCRFFNNSGIDLELCGNLKFGNIRITNALFTNKVNTALKLIDFTNAPDAATLQINNSSFNPGDTNSKTPIVCIGTSDLPVGNVKFTNTAVASPVHKKAICFDLKKKSGHLEGFLPVIAADGNRMNAILTVEEKNVQ